MSHRQYSDFAMFSSLGLTVKMGSVAIVTGGARGIGQKVTEKLACLGVTVVIGKRVQEHKCNSTTDAQFLLINKTGPFGNNINNNKITPINISDQTSLTHQNVDLKDPVPD